MAADYSAATAAPLRLREGSRGSETGHRAAADGRRAGGRGPPRGDDREADPQRAARPRAFAGSGPPGPHPAGRGLRPEAAVEVDGPRARALLHVLGVRHPGHGLPRGLRSVVQGGLRDLVGRALGGSGVPAGHDRGAVPDLARGVRGDPHPQRPGAREAGQPVLRLPHRWGVADPVHDLQRVVDAVLLPGRVLGAGHLPLQVRRVGVDRARAPLHGSVHRRARGGREHRPAAAHRRDARLPDHHRLQQAPAHLRRADQRLGQALPEGAGPVAGDDLCGQADRLRRSR